MEEYQVTLTKAEIWMLLGALETSTTECTCDWDFRLEEELLPHVNWNTLESKLKEVLYGPNQIGTQTSPPENDR
jgi:hypothetical protein